MRENRRNLLGFPKLNQPVAILSSEANAPLGYFAIRKKRLFYWPSNEGNTLGLA